MNFYVDCAKILLEKISDKKLHYEEFLNQWKNKIVQKIQNADYIIVCGETAVGKKCLEAIKKYTDVPVVLFDIIHTPPLYSRSFEYINDIYDLSGEKLFLLTSRENCINYLEILPKLNSDYLSINELFILDKNFGIPNSLMHNSDFVIGTLSSVFNNAQEYREILESLTDNFSRELLSRLVIYRISGDINVMRNISSSYKPYFDEEIIMLDNEEIFIDAGGYDGDTLSDFLECTNKNFKAYYFFEPNKNLFNEVVKKFGVEKNIFFFQKGLSDKTENQKFSLSSTGKSNMLKLSESDEKNFNEIIETIALDDLPDVAPTFIKMDIEGMECAALSGGEKIIRKYLPKMAICIYHRPNDLINIYHKLKSFGYKKFFLRTTFNSLDYDIVMYAVP